MEAEAKAKRRGRPPKKKTYAQMTPEEKVEEHRQRPRAAILANIARVNERIAGRLVRYGYKVTRPDGKKWVTPLTDEEIRQISWHKYR